MGGSHTVTAIATRASTASRPTRARLAIRTIPGLHHGIWSGVFPVRGISGLLERLAGAARQRGLLEAGASVSAARAFALVRDIPYGRASSRRPEVIIDEWRGTCSGKHY